MAKLVLVLLAVLPVAINVPAEAAPPVKAGLNLDADKEKQLAEDVGKILAAAKAEQPDYARQAESIAAARGPANELAAMAERKDDPDAKPRPVDTPDLPARSPVVVPPGCEAKQVLDAWGEQLVLRLRSVHEVLTDPNTDTVPKWNEAIGVGWRHRNDLTKRARPLADALREAHAFALLLARPAEAIPVTRGKVLFADAMTESADNWHLYGPCDTTQDKQGLRRKNKRVRHADTTMWTKREFSGDFLYELTFTPNNGGPKPGVLFPICGRPVKEGGDLSVSAGETMDSYNLGVHAYHFSIHRGDTNICNGRRVGTGLHVIGSRTPDPAAEAGRAYRVAVGKVGAVVFFLVDGKLQHSYYDAGTFGPPLTAGSVGTRHWGGADATYRDVRVSRLERVEDKDDKSADSVAEPAEQGKP